MHNEGYPPVSYTHLDGHLSNADCAYSVSRLVEDGVRRVMLGHLSETNNRPDIALSESKKALDVYKRQGQGRSAGRHSG